MASPTSPSPPPPSLDIAGLQPKYYVGLRTSVQNNVYYVTDEDVLYPIGGVLTLHNFANKKQKFIRLPEKGYNVNLMCVSPNRKVVAVSENGDLPCVTVFCTTTLKRKKQIPVPTDRGITAKTVECMTFTTESKSLIVVYGEPDWMLFSFKWDKGRIESQTRANNMNNTGIPRQVACNPTDPSVLVVVGDVLFRLMAVTESVWRQYGYNKAELLYLRCITWLSQERLLTGTHDGRLLMMENGELKSVFKVYDCMTINLQLKDDQAQASATSLLAGGSESVMTFDQEVRCIVSFPKGFICECGTGKIHFFEKETAHKFNKRNIFVLEDDPEFDIVYENEEEEPPIKINCIAVSPNQEYIVVSCGIQQLYTAYLWGPDITKNPEIKLQELGHSIHRGTVRKMAICQWKPILMTAGKGDKTLRIWNYETMDLIIRKVYQEDVYGVALHPSGLYALAGFSGKLRFLTILIDDFAVTREFAIRYCNVCRFSTQGHLFAAVNGNIIQIYCTISFENIVNLKGHNGRVISIGWVLMDYKLVSCGTDGALYEWNVSTGKRTIEFFSKSCTFTVCRITNDAKSIYYCGSDGHVKELCNGVLRNSHLIEPTGLDSLEVAHSDKMMFTSGNFGTMWSVKLPMTEKPDHVDYNVHNTTVYQLRVTLDDKYLISCSDDGSICLWKIVNAADKQIKLDKDYTPSIDILIPYKDLEEKIQLINDLNVRMSELDRENAYQVRQIEARHTNKMKEIHEAYKEAIQELKDKNNALENEHIQEVHAINLKINDTKAEHDLAIQTVEGTFNEKLRVEYERYATLEDKLVKVRQAYNAQIEELENARRESEEQITEKFLQKLHDKDVQLDEIRYEIQSQVKDHEVVKQQIEDDADREIFELRTHHEKELKEEQTINIKIRAENGIYKKKLLASQREIDELKHRIFVLESEQSKFKKAIQNLEKDIMELKKEITERDDTIQEREKKIYGLKKRVQELEKYKFVLEFKIEELRIQIEPRERRIFEQKEQINDMIRELENLQKRITSHELHLNELKRKLAASKVELKREQTRFKIAKDLIKKMRNDLFRASGLMQEPHRLKTVVRELFHKYNADTDFMLTQEEDCDVRTEFQMQRFYLEKSIGQLKQQIIKKKDVNQDKIKIIEESSELITETNALRTQLKSVEKSNRQMESILGITKTVKPSEAQKRVNEALKSRAQIRQEFSAQLTENENIIAALQEENERLIFKLTVVRLEDLDDDDEPEMEEENAEPVENK